MQVAHKQEEGLKDLLVLAKKSEKADDLITAAKLYHRILKRYPNNPLAHNRLMIVYRKQKAYAKELLAIQHAIDAFSKLYAPKTAHTKSVRSLSAKLNKAFGMTDKKGNNLYEPGPIAVWKKRKALVEKRMKK